MCCFCRRCNENGYMAACNIESNDGIHVLSSHFWLCYASCVRISKDWVKNTDIGQDMERKKYGSISYMLWILKRVVKHG